MFTVLKFRLGNLLYLGRIVSWSIRCVHPIHQYAIIVLTDFGICLCIQSLAWHSSVWHLISKLWCFIGLGSQCSCLGVCSFIWLDYWIRLLNSFFACSLSLITEFVYIAWLPNSSTMLLHIVKESPYLLNSCWHQCHWATLILCPYNSTKEKSIVKKIYKQVG